MHLRGLSMTAAVALLGAGGLALAQEPHGPHERPENWTGPNVTTVNTTRYVPMRSHGTYYPKLPRTMSDGTVREGPVEAPPGPPVKPPQPAPVPGTGPQPPQNPKANTIFLAEPAQTQHTALWSNFWEANRARILKQVRGHGMPAKGVDGDVWEHAALQSAMRCVLDEDPIVAGFAALVAARSGRPELYKLIERASMSRGPNANDHIARCGAIMGLGLTGNPQAGMQLQRIVTEYLPMGTKADVDADGKQDEVSHEIANRTEWRAAFAVAALGLLRQPDQFDYLQQLVRREDMPTRVRSAAILAIGELPYDRAAAELAGYGQTPSLPHIARGMACLALGRMDSPSVGGPFGGKVRSAQVLLDYLPAFAKDSRSMRLGCAMGLWYCAKAEDLPAIRAAVSDQDDVQTRCTLLAVLGWKSRGDGSAGRARTMLARYTRMEQPAVVRGFACLALGLVGDPAGHAALLERLQKDPDSHVQGAAAVGLGLLGDPAHADALVDAYAPMRTDLDRSVDAAYVLEGLGLCGGDTARAVLRKIFQEPKVIHHRRAAGLGLALMGDTSIIDGLIADLGSEEDWRPGGAAVALMQYADSKILDRVRRLATSRNSDEGMRQLAVKVLGAWVRGGDGDRVGDLAADGVVFPKNDAHILHDLLNWP